MEISLSRASVLRHSQTLVVSGLAFRCADKCMFVRLAEGMGTYTRRDTHIYKHTDIDIHTQSLALQSMYTCEPRLGLDLLCERSQVNRDRCELGLCRHFESSRTIDWQKKVHLAMHDEL